MDDALVDAPRGEGPIAPSADGAVHGRRIGAVVQAHERVGSTMDVAAAWAAAGAPDGAVVVADVQTAGRGRHGRSWLAPPGTAVTLSIVLRPAVPPARVPQAPMAVALGAVEAVAAHAWAGPTGPSASDDGIARLGLKWPNDLVAGDAKLAGLLAETIWGADGGPVVIVGLGLNVAQTAGELPPGATSIRRLRPDGAAPINRAALTAALLTAADRHYADLLAGADLVPRWAARLTTIGRVVTVRDAVAGAVVVEGVATGVTDDGALVVASADGGAVTVRAGDVTLRGGRGVALGTVA